MMLGGLSLLAWLGAQLWRWLGSSVKEWEWEWECVPGAAHDRESPTLTQAHPPSPITEA